jgi:hypothetical protein
MYSKKLKDQSWLLDILFLLPQILTLIQLFPPNHSPTIFHPSPPLTPTHKKSYILFLKLPMNINNLKSELKFPNRIGATLSVD